MDFKNCESFVIPFQIEKESAWKDVIRYLGKKETTPVESLCNNHVVSIEKEYYPVERLVIIYTAKWDAVSIFKEYWTEQETHYEPEIHYFDRFGGEHKHAGYDYFDSKSGRWKSGTVHPIMSRIKGYSGNVESRPWRPQEVTVAVTEDVPYERETGRQNNSGDIQGNYIYYHSKGYSFFDSLFSGLEYQAEIPYSEEIVKDGTVMKQRNPFNQNDFNDVFSKAKSDAQNRCIEKIPGQGYENYRMEFDTNEDRQIWYYPVYHIIYEFMGQKYECFVSGCQEGRVYGKHDPEDSSIESIKKEYENRLLDLDKKKTKYRLNYIWIWLGVPTVSWIFSMVFLKLFPTLNLDGVLNIADIAAIIFLFRLNHRSIKNIKKEIAECEEAKNHVVPIRQKKKKDIMDVVLDDSLSNSEKEVRCKEILKYSGPVRTGN